MTLRHTCMVAESLCQCPQDADAFARCLARRLRWWLLGVPAGIGFATLRAILYLWLGFSPQRSGVFSAGNGPAMRSAISLVLAFDDLAPAGTASSIRPRSSRIPIPRRTCGALAVALAAEWVRKPRAGLPPVDFCRQHRSLPGYSRSDECDALIAAGRSRVWPSGASNANRLRKRSVPAHAGCPATYTAPFQLCSTSCWLTRPRDFRKAVSAVVRCGGDTDTTGAIVGAIVGSAVGRAGLPA